MHKQCSIIHGYFTFGHLAALAMAVMVMAGAGGCQTSPGGTGSTAGGTGPYGVGASRPVASNTLASDRQPLKEQSNAKDVISPASSQPIAYVAGQPVVAGEMFSRLLSHSGGQVLSELVLDKLIDQRLAVRGVIISRDMIAAEKQYLLNEISSDPDEAIRLLKKLRESRGISNQRFEQTLHRNAALRVLTRDLVAVTDQEVKQAYDMAYGERYEARIITTATLNQMQKILAQLGGNKSFIDLAITDSTDPTSAQGGLLPPISASDATYPAAVRNVLVTLAQGQVSHPIALDTGYAILKLERKIQALDVKFDDVKDELTQSVKRQNEQNQMRLMARSLLEQADVVVLDPVLKESWDHQKQLLDQGP